MVSCGRSRDDVQLQSEVFIDDIISYFEKGQCISILSNVSLEAMDTSLWALPCRYLSQSVSFRDRDLYHWRFSIHINTQCGARKVFLALNPRSQPQYCCDVHAIPNFVETSILIRVKPTSHYHDIWFTMENRKWNRPPFFANVVNW